ncbi:hypothetical protein U1Q18_009370 [Sarracenia purpurea var. burkii]
MDAEFVMNIFDSCWFSLEIFKNQPRKSNPETNPEVQNPEKLPEPKVSILPTLHVRSKSDQLSSMGIINSDSLSPNSVLFTSHLHTILSGREVAEEEEADHDHDDDDEEKIKSTIEVQKPKKNRSMRRMRTKKGMTKSMSDLEFEELKGFMDLGFVFSEDDRNSRLVEIIPGLQRLGKEGYGENKEMSSDNECSVPRPYLSEAWEVLERTEREKPLIMNLRFPPLSNEIDMKDSLKWWAHAVASAVR